MYRTSKPLKILMRATRAEQKNTRDWSLRATNKNTENTIDFQQTANHCRAKHLFLLITLSSIGLLTHCATQAEPATDALYQKHCAQCHNPDRLGKTGPALLPENLGRLPQDQAITVIQKGRAASQMPAFTGILTDPEIEQLTKLIYTPLPKTPEWNLKKIRKSYWINKHRPTGSKPRFAADPQNLFIVIELGDHHATLLDGDTFTPIQRFQTRFAVHGGPKFSPDGRYVYFASRDGWISKYDIYNLSWVAEIRAGINTRNAAVSHDGRYVIVGNYLPHTLVLLDAENLKPIKIIPVSGKQNKTSRVSAVYTAPPRNSFIVALKDIAEIWEIPYTHRTRKKHHKSDFPVRKIPINNYLDDFFFDQNYQNIIGAARPSENHAKISAAQIVHIDNGKTIATVDIDGMPHLASGITWTRDNKTLLATQNLLRKEISIIDMNNGKLLKKIQTLGSGFFMRTHENTDYAWADIFTGPDKDKIHIIDKRTLEIVRTLTPEPGKTAAHIEFTQDGRYALVSIWENDGAIVVYDAESFEAIKRIPMRKPSGKYNIYNKTHYVSGTSH